MNLLKIVRILFSITTVSSLTIICFIASCKKAPQVDSQSWKNKIIPEGNETASKEPPDEPQELEDPQTEDLISEPNDEPASTSKASTKPTTGDDKEMSPAGNRPPMDDKEKDPIVLKPSIPMPAVPATPAPAVPATPTPAVPATPTPAVPATPTTAVPAMPAPAPVPRSPGSGKPVQVPVAGKYYFKGVASGRCITIANGDTFGFPLELKSCSDPKTQAFILELVGDNKFRIYSPYLRVVEIRGGMVARNGTMQQGNTYVKGDHQHFVLELQVDKKTYMVRVHNSDLAWEVANEGIGDGSIVVAGTANSSSHERWTLIPVE